MSIPTVDSILDALKVKFIYSGGWPEPLRFPVVPDAVPENVSSESWQDCDSSER